MDPQSAIYQLRCELRGHEEDVRGICICVDNAIATGSRDKTVRYWCVDEAEKNKYKLAKTMVGHTSFVGPVAWMPPNERFPEGGIASGGMDTSAFAWDLRTAQQVYTMIGHQYQVTGVTLDDQGNILSCSIDCTVKRWRNGQCIETWQAHQSPVQAIVQLPTGEIVTGSTDATMKIWKGSTCIRTVSAHSDTVRGLAVMPNLGILSASHDGSIKLWALSGELLMEMVGHTSLVYSVAAHPSGVIASGSEDRFAKLWIDGVCVQSIEHPGSVWDVKFLQNGDLVTACSDGVIRIWTENQERVASKEDIDAFELQLSVHKCSTKTVGGMKVSELPGIEALQQPGKKQGQTIVIREGDNGVAYSWNSKEYTWEKIGEVVDGPDAAQGQPTHNGIAYDYVFDVDIGDGQPTRKLPYNRGDNPYTVADQWLLKEDLPLAFREQIVEFILKNTGQTTVVQSDSFVDPYTGANAYVPGRQSSGMSGTNAKYEFQHIPKKGMLIFDTAQYDGIMRKVTEFNTKIKSDVEQCHCSLNDQEVAQLHAIVAVLKDTSHYHTRTFADNDMTVVVKILSSWPVEMLFPVMDLVKMIVLHPHGASIFSSYIEGDSDILLNVIRKIKNSAGSASNQLTSIRMIVNTFRHSYFRDWLSQKYSEILDIFSDCCSSSNKNVRLAYSTLILNYSMLLVDTKDEEGQLLVLSAAMEMADSTEQDTDVRFRAVVAIGSLMHDGLVKRQALDLDVGGIAKSAAKSSDKRIVEVGADLDHLITMA